jgi:hypothetical protein
VGEVTRVARRQVKENEMSEQTKSLIRQLALVIFGSAFLAPLLARFNITLEMLPGLIDTLIQLGALIAGAVASWLALKNRSDKAIVEKAAEMVPVPAESQAKVGIVHPVAPKNPT